MAANTKGTKSAPAKQAPAPSRPKLEAENKKAQAANIKQNTRNQGHQQDR